MADITTVNSERSMQSRPTRRWTSAALLLAAAAYLGYYVISQWQSLERALQGIRFSMLFAATAAILPMLALKSLYHVLALRRLGQAPLPRATTIIDAYAGSQIIRYLPGKVLGVMYEAARLAEYAPAHRIIAANVVQSLHTLAMTVAVLAAVAVWLVKGETHAAWFLIFAATGALWVTHRIHLTERALACVARRLPRLRDLPSLPMPSGHASLLASVMLLAEWLPYFLFWALLLPPNADIPRDAILLGACYAGASMIANFAVLMPSGLFLREALFLWAGKQLQIDPASLLVLGVLSRLLLTLADAVFVPLAWGASRHAMGTRA